MPRSAYFAASALLGLALVALTFAGAGGLQLDDATRVELPLIVLGGLVVALGVLYGRRGAVSGALPLALFAALAALTALSVSWSIAPSESWIEANRTLAYLMAFAAALVAARMFPQASGALANALIIALGAVSVYALVTRVWPGALSADDQFARISEPLGYWNAVGATAAMAIPLLLWLGARRSGSPLGRALAFPMLGLAILTMLLTQSRGSLVAGLLGIALWLAVVPLRLRTLPVLLIPSVVAGSIAAWALSKGAFTLDRAPGIVRESVANEFGIMLGVGFLLLLLAGLVVGFRQSLRTPTLRSRRRLGIAMAAAILALPLFGVAALAASDRGITGTVSYRVQQLTGEETATAGGPERLTQFSSTRSRYWRQAGRVFASAPMLGTGADTWGVARLRYRVDQVPAQHAHGYVAQVMSDLGTVGLVLIGALALAWLYAALRNTGLHPRGRGREWTADRVTLAALVLVAVVFAFHSALDWTWFVPGPTVMAMFAAGWVAGLRPPRPEEEAARVGRTDAAGTGAATAGGIGTGAAPAGGAVGTNAATAGAAGTGATTAGAAQPASAPTRAAVPAAAGAGPVGTAAAPEATAAAAGPAPAGVAAGATAPRATSAPAGVAAPGGSATTGGPTPPPPGGAHGPGSAGSAPNASTTETQVLSGATGRPPGADGAAPTAGTTPGSHAGTAATPGGDTAGSLPEAPSAGERLKVLLRRDGWRIGLALGIVAATALFAWSAWQPQRADALTERALAQLEAGRIPDAAADADRAMAIDPLSTKPLFTRATVADAAGDSEQAERLLQRAVREHPADPRTWLRLGDYQLHSQNRPEAALETLNGAIYLDPQSRAARSYWLEARGRTKAEEEQEEEAQGDGDGDGDGEST